MDIRLLSSRVRDGYVAVVEAGWIRIVADGFYFTNEVRLDAKEEWLYIVETTGPHVTLMLDAKGTIAPWMASITFGSPDLKTVYPGNLLGTRIPYFRSPVAGLPLVHWHSSF